jgi:arsenite methyltransferase
MESENIKKAVRDGYAKIAKSGSCGCGPQISSCCGSATSADKISKSIGYSDEDINAVPKEANLGLGCGNPIALASLKAGETVLDLGSGAGFDCFLASPKVGSTGKVIGVDMTPEMIDKARRNAKDGAYQNVEFRLGEIENLPVADNSVDIIISNCVINLSTDKSRVFSEAKRVLKPDGRIMVSDLVLTRDLPPYIKDSVQAYIGCICGAMLKDNYLAAIERAGLTDIKVLEETTYPLDDLFNDISAREIIKKSGKSIEELDRDFRNTFMSIKVSARKTK